MLLTLADVKIIFGYNFLASLSILDDSASCRFLSSILDDVEFYEKQKPFTLEDLLKMSSFFNAMVFKLIWNEQGLYLLPCVFVASCLFLKLKTLLSLFNSILAIFMVSQNHQIYIWKSMSYFNNVSIRNLKRSVYVKLHPKSETVFHDGEECQTFWRKLTWFFTDLLNIHAKHTGLVFPICFLSPSFSYDFFVHVISA